MCGSEPRSRCDYNQTAATAQALLQTWDGPMGPSSHEWNKRVVYTARFWFLDDLENCCSYINIAFSSRESHRLIATISKITVTLNVHKLEHPNCNEEVGNIKFNKHVKYNLIIARWKAQAEVAITRMHSKTSSLYFPKSAADTPTDFPTARRRSYLFHKNEPI